MRMIPLILALMIFGCTAERTMLDVPAHCIEVEAAKSERYESNRAFKCDDTTLGMTVMISEQDATDEMDSILKMAEDYVPKEGENIIELETKECQKRRFFYVLSEKDNARRSAVFLQEGKLLVSIAGNAKELAEEMGLLC